MKKALAITLILALMLGASAFATKTRVQTMGDNNNILLDEANIWLYPGRLFQYPDMAVAEYGYSSIYSVPFDAGGTEGLSAPTSVQEFGVHWKFGEEKPFVVGTYLYNAEGQVNGEAYLNEGLPLGLNTELSQIFGFSNSSEWGFVPDNDFVDFALETSNRRIGLFYSRQLGGYNFGFYFDKLHNSLRSEELNGSDVLVNDYDQSFSRYTFGFGLTETSGKWDIAAKLALVTWRDKEYNYADTVEQDNTKPGGNMMFSVMGRYFYQHNPTVTFVPHIGFTYGKFKSEDYYYFNGTSTDWYDDPETYEYSGMVVDLGSGLHYTPSAGMLAVLDFGVSLANIKFETMQFNSGTTEFDTFESTFSVTTLPYVKIGFEGEVFNWMDIRFGGTTYWRSFSYEDKDSEGTVDEKGSNRYPNNMTYLGFAFNWGNLTVDTWTDPQLFLEGLNFISGGDTYMNGGVSAVYNF